VKRRRQPLPQGVFPLTITGTTHDGRGIGEIDSKKIFVDGALAGETIEFVYTKNHSRYSEGRAENIIHPSSLRVTPECPTFLKCGGCSLQHLNRDAQIELKQNVLKEQFEHFGKVSPEEWLPPLTAKDYGYRRKARLGVRYVEKKGGVLIGFREKNSNYLTVMNECSILEPMLARLIPLLKDFISTLEGKCDIPQIEVAAGDDACALVVRHMQPLSEKDYAEWLLFFEKHNVQGYLQPAGPDSVHLIYPENGNQRLYYDLNEFSLQMGFHPLDFVQVNAEINRKMVPCAINLLEVTAEDRVLDLFCGLGNFTLPLARRAAFVVGVEGDAAMTERATENANHNQIHNVKFYAADCFKDFSKEPWLNDQYTKLLIDPPRSGALEIVQNIHLINPSRIVYVSCNPATLARDAGELCARGYGLKCVGVMDMFPHTTHVESIAVFERYKK
jgi:23S rRNA (uracil1939-C5)-methyltransferase